jgi:hypothetical protein
VRACRISNSFVLFSFRHHSLLFPRIQHLDRWLAAIVARPGFRAPPVLTPFYRPLITGQQPLTASPVPLTCHVPVLVLLFGQCSLIIAFVPCHEK